MDEPDPYRASQGSDQGSETVSKLENGSVQNAYGIHESSLRRQVIGKHFGVIVAGQKLWMAI